MPVAENVQPQKWSNTIVLFDDDTYSAVWGSYDDEQHRSLGVRWNGVAGDCGYPNQGGNPLWYVEPEFLTEGVLTSLLSVAMQRGEQEYTRNLRVALDEFRQP